MGNGQYRSSDLEINPYDLSWLPSSGDESGTIDAVVAIVGLNVAGSVKGGRSQIVIGKNIDLQKGFQFSKGFEPDSRKACTKIVSCICPNEIFICALIENMCVLLTPSRSGNDIILRKNVEFKADFSSGGIVTCACILPSGHIVTGGDDGICRLWVITFSKKQSWTVKPLQQMEGHTAPIANVSFHPSDALVSI